MHTINETFTVERAAPARSCRRAIAVADRYYLMRHGTIVDDGAAADAGATMAAAYFATSADGHPSAVAHIVEDR